MRVRNGTIEGGFLDMGDHLEVCNRCGGLGKVVGLWCAACQGSGLVREEAPRE